MNIRKLFLLRCNGFNSVEIGEKMKLHPVTIRNKLLELKKMPQEDFDKLLKSYL